MSKKRKDIDAIEEISKMLSPERVNRAKKEAEAEVFRIRLSELREKQGLTQKDLKDFSQSSVSKIESRKDMKISTLMEYLDNLGMGLEIKAYSKGKESKKITLLKL